MGSVTIRRDNPKALENIAKALQPGTVKIGWFPSARYDDEKSTPVAAIAAQNEYGNPNKNIPARPFIRPAIIRDQKTWEDIAKRVSTSISMAEDEQDRGKWEALFYDMVSKMEFIPSTPCLMNARPDKTGQLSSCFIIDFKVLGAKSLL